MIVCLCRGLSTADILETVAVGAVTVEDVGDACGAGTDCRTCCDTLAQLLADAREGAYAVSAR
jgi:bacterioferritin-associated ferredoxin